MSYVYCGYCGTRGHNKLGCPTRKKIAQEQPDSYVGRQVAKEQRDRAAAVASRTCSYCDTPGHNRRGCTTLKEDKELITARQKRYREHFVETSGSVGFGPGALVHMSRGAREEPWSKSIMALVTEFNWEGIDFLNQDTDLTQNWQARRRQIAVARIVSTNGFDPEGDRWSTPPKQNERVSLTISDLVQIIPLAFDPSFREQPPRNDDSLAALVGPTKNVSYSIPTDLAAITQWLNKAFHLNPDKRADNWDKARISLGADVWKEIYPESYAKFNPGPNG